MKTIEWVYLLKFGIFSGLLTMAIIVVRFFVREYYAKRTAEELEYLQKYICIQDNLLNSDKNSETDYNFIESDIAELRKMTYKNKEKTETLETEFHRMFTKIWLTRIIEEGSYSPVNVLSN